MDSGAQVDAVYTDLKAAFDRVDHGILVARLEKIGVSPAFVAWFSSYLSDRTLYVKIGSAQSERFSNSSGVPQGSNLGPLLFALFINEIDTLLPPGCRMFYADDVKIYMLIKSLADCFELQRMVDCFEEWCSRNFMTVSVPKCSIISFHRKLTPIVFDYTLAGQPLQRATEVRDLGVILDSALTFRMHYSDVISRANRQLGFIFKISTDFRDPLCLRSLYCSLVRSILESSVVAWCPYHAYWKARIEAVQRKFVRYALRNLPWNNPSNLPRYEHRCQLLGIETLERRRSNAQAVFVAKVLKGEIDAPHILTEVHLYAPERNLRQRDFLFLRFQRTQYALHEPIRYMCCSFNDVFELFDFNITTRAFQNRLSSRR